MKLRLHSLSAFILAMALVHSGKATAQNAGPSGLTSEPLMAKPFYQSNVRFLQTELLLTVDMNQKALLRTGYDPRNSKPPAVNPNGVVALFMCKDKQLSAEQCIKYELGYSDDPIWYQSNRIKISVTAMLADLINKVKVESNTALNPHFFFQFCNGKSANCETEETGFSWRERGQVNSRRIRFSEGISLLQASVSQELQIPFPQDIAEKLGTSAKEFRFSFNLGEAIDELRPHTLPTHFLNVAKLKGIMDRDLRVLDFYLLSIGFITKGNHAFWASYHNSESSVQAAGRVSQDLGDLIKEMARERSEDLIGVYKQQIHSFQTFTKVNAHRYRLAENFIVTGASELVDGDRKAMLEQNREALLAQSRRTGSRLGTLAGLTLVTGAIAASMHVDEVLSKH